MKLVSIWTFLILYAINMLFYLFLFQPRLETYPTKTFDGRMEGFRPSEAEGILQQFKVAGKLDEYLEQEWKIDLIYPLVYTAMLLIGIIGLTPNARARRWLATMPILAAIGDYTENFSVMGMIVQYRDHGTIQQPLAVLASVASRVKWGFTFASFATVAVLAVWWVVRKVRARQ